MLARKIQAKNSYRNCEAGTPPISSRQPRSGSTGAQHRGCEMQRGVTVNSIRRKNESEETEKEMR